LIAKAKSDAAKVDIGRPSVPAYGRQLYNRNVWNTIRPRNQLPVPVRRKIAAATLISPESKAEWILAYEDILRCLRSARFDGVVLDYDGTLCDPQYRFSALPMNVAAELERMVRLGAAVGIATGRGKSVRKSLQKSLPSALWPKVTLGYYNCSQIASLDDETMPDNSDVPSDDLREPLKILSRHPELTEIATLEARGKQITVSPVVPGAARRVRELVADLLSNRFYTDSKVVYSTHSVDVLSKAVSKLAILSHLEQKIGRNLTLLRIGDLGRWPGNDFELLSSPTGVSCNTVSAHLSECWNLAPVGERNSQATIYYLRALSRTAIAPHPSFALRIKKTV
jgi:hydroxymethylpyrimidine pyrophosphatase-like HAD family hydrolase